MSQTVAADARSLARFLATAKHWGYQASGPSFAEPAAFVALALLEHDPEAASAPLSFLAAAQNNDGAVQVVAEAPEPAWTTSLAVLAWAASGRDEFRRSIERGVDWLLRVEGTTEEVVSDARHDATLVGWPWVQGTHSWIEPTAFALLALRAAGRAESPRALEAERLLIDRLLPQGGCNYGNTTVLGQTLRPHPQPTGLTLWALAGVETPDDRVAKSIDYLAATIGPDSPPTSLAFSLLGMTLHGRRPGSADEWIASWDGRADLPRLGAYKAALLLLAAAPERKLGELGTKA